MSAEKSRELRISRANIDSWISGIRTSDRSIDFVLIFTDRAAALSDAMSHARVQRLRVRQVGIAGIRLYCAVAHLPPNEKLVAEADGVRYVYGYGATPDDAGVAFVERMIAKYIFEYEPPERAPDTVPAPVIPLDALVRRMRELGSCSLTVAIEFGVEYWYVLRGGRDVPDKICIGAGTSPEMALTAALERST